MKLTIQTKDIHIEYQDDYSNLTEDVKKRIIEIIQAIPITQTNDTNFPINTNSTYVGNVESFFNPNKK